MEMYIPGGRKAELKSEVKSSDYAVAVLVSGSIQGSHLTY